MYAIVKTGGKQYRVEKGLELDVELLGAGKKTVNLDPVLVVDGKKVIIKPIDLKKIKVKAKVLDEEVKGPKIVGFTYKSSSNQRRRYGHRQKYSRIQITEIGKPVVKKKAPASKTTTKAKPKTTSKTAPKAKAKTTTKKAPTTKKKTSK